MQCGLCRICVVWWWSYDCGGSGTETVAVSVAGAEAGAKAEASLSARMHASWRQFGYADKAFIGHIKRVKLLPRGQFRAVPLCAREQISIPNSNQNLYCCHVVYPSDLLSLSLLSTVSIVAVHSLSPNKINVSTNSISYYFKVGFLS